MDLSLRKSIYSLMIILSLGLILGRILAVDTVNKQDLQKYRLNQIPKQLAEKEERLKGRVLLFLRFRSGIAGAWYPGCA